MATMGSMVSCYATAGTILGKFCFKHHEREELVQNEYGEWEPNEHEEWVPNNCGRGKGFLTNSKAMLMNFSGGSQTQLGLYVTFKPKDSTLLEKTVRILPPDAGTFPDLRRIVVYFSLGGPDNDDDSPVRHQHLNCAVYQKTTGQYKISAADLSYADPCIRVLASQVDRPAQLSLACSHKQPILDSKSESDLMIPTYKPRNMSPPEVDLTSRTDIEKKAFRRKHSTIV